MPPLTNQVLYLGPDAKNIPGLSSYSSGIEEAESIVHLGPITSINLLVGANNSGKSRFMRSVMNANQYVLFKDSSSFLKYNDAVQKLQNLYDELESYSEIKFRLINIGNQGHSLEFLNAEHEKLFNQRISQEFVLNKQYVGLIISQLKDIFIIDTQTLETRINRFEEYLSTIRIASKTVGLSSDVTQWPHYRTGTIVYSKSGIHTSQKELLEEATVALSDIENWAIQVSPSSKIYVPILRTARALLPESDEGNSITAQNRRELTKIFTQTIAKSYAIDEATVEIQTGLDLYSKIHRNRNDSRENRLLFDRFEEFISRNFFQGKSFEIVARYAEPGEEEHLHVSINNAEHEIHFLGDGIQALIVILYPIFLAKPDSWVFIEEPEVHLHPGMQRLFIETLLNDDTIKQKNLKVFMTTHSNHLFDIAVDNQHQTSVLAFQKVEEQPPKFTIVPTDTGQLKILDLLEVNNSSVFMANCAIWVEGPTDRIYLRKYLDEYVATAYPKLLLHEDLEYCFFEYAGSNLSHYIFSKEPERLSSDEVKQINAWFLSNRIFLVADADSDKDKKHSTLSMQQSERFIYCKLPVREIENLLSPSIIASQLPSIIGSWGNQKRQDWHAAVQASPLKAKEYKNEYLGAFLKRKYSTLTFPKSFLAGSSTVPGSGTLSSRYKVKLAKQVASSVTWLTMSAEARVLAKRMFAFIVSHNPLLGKLVKSGIH